jgi:hypothetical protein
MRVIRHADAGAGREGAGILPMPAQISQPLQLLGDPNALTSRSAQGCASEIAVPADVVTAKATASGPLSAAIRRSAAAVSSRASSQLMRRHPGSGSPFGRVRRKG